MILQPNVSRALAPLLAPSRYKGAFGGRGSGKSHLFAELLLARAIEQPGLHAVCIREIQKSLAQSAKRTIELKIQAHGVGHLFDVQKSEIKTPGGGLIIFQGMQNHTADSIKSLEGYDVAWVEEAQTLSATSLKMLRPTIRKKTRLADGSFRESEIWFSWNPRKADDPVDAFLRANELPPRSTVVRANWHDNPWFHETALVDEEKFDAGRDQETYEHVWLGEYERNSEARVFRNWKVDWFETPPDAVFYLGADWGFSIDPTVCIRCFIVGRTLYIDREVWALGCEIDRTPALFDKIDPTWTAEKARDPNWKSIARRLPITADSARPETISYMQRNGFPRMRAAIKGAGSVEDGIEFLKSYDIVIHPECTHVAKEFARYSFKIDPKTDEVTNVLADKENHLLDACRYALENVRRAVTSSHEALRI